jgi:hypothetical protein
MATYRPVSERAKALHGDEPFEADLTPSEESDQLGRRTPGDRAAPYRVLVNNFAAGGQDDVVDLALLVEEEGALLAGGFLERSDPPKKTAKK